ncbi:unnamed protein product, partial [Mesorhabditis spiculigera]
MELGHNPSPYLRRCRIPQLNTIRFHEDPCTPEDEEGKMELIREKMQELTDKSKRENPCSPSTSIPPQTQPKPATSLRGSEHEKPCPPSSYSRFSMPPSSYRPPRTDFSSKVVQNRPKILKIEPQNGVAWNGGFV